MGDVPTQSVGTIYYNGGVEVVNSAVPLTGENASVVEKLVMAPWALLPINCTDAVPFVHPELQLKPKLLPNSVKGMLLAVANKFSEPRFIEYVFIWPAGPKVAPMVMVPSTSVYGVPIELVAFKITELYVADPIRVANCVWVNTLLL